MLDTNTLNVEFEEDEDGKPRMVLDHESLEKLERMAEVGFIKLPEEREVKE